MFELSDTTVLNFLESFDVRIHRLPNKSDWVAGSGSQIAFGSTVREALRNLMEKVRERCHNDAFNASRSEFNRLD